ncbi:MAG: hypothetical protein KAH00_02135 [Cocleimonas sp.]|nr:hypothetical protein [Cocleimonas sp.]
MSKFSIFALISLFVMSTLTACFDETKAPQKKAEQAIEYDQFGNPAVYTADGEKELIDDDCD